MRSNATTAFFAGVALSALGPLASLAADSNATWTLSDSIAGDDFFDKFDFFSDKDPTNGLVLYQTESAAKSANLSYVDTTSNNFVMAVDTVEVALEGRKSIRISSKTSYSDGIYVLNVSHVPIGCAAWPAFWTVTEDLDSYPTGGEIDILENANDEWKGARTSLHTKDSCTIPSTISDQSGVVAFTNCSVYTSGNTGCTVEMNGTSTPSWGKSFNAQGGGIVAMERSLGSTGHGIRVWYWQNGEEPDNLRSGSQNVETSGWGKPGADFDVADSCHEDFGPHKITFDITLCGDLAGNRYNLSGCNNQYPACSYQVGYNGSSFNQSYWSINDLRIYASGGGSDNAANSPNTSTEGASSGALRSYILPLELVALASTVLAGATFLIL